MGHDECLRLLHVIPGIAARYGGPSRAVVEMCVALRDAGVEPLIATTDADGEGRLEVPLGIPVDYQGAQAIFFPRDWSEAFKYSSGLRQWLEESVADFDVVHVHAVFSHSSVTAARICRRQRIPYVVRPLGSLGTWSLEQKWLRKRVLWHLGVRSMLVGAECIHYTTDEERRQAEAVIGPCPAAVIPLGVDAALLATAPNGSRSFHDAVERPGPYVLALGRLHPKKALEPLLEAFLDLVEAGEFRDWHLIVAGEGDAGYVARLAKLVERRDGRERVRFTGWLEGDTRLDVLRNAALLALPSRQENFGLSVVEALACGVPALVGAEMDLAADIASAGAGWVATPQREALRRTLAQALRDEAERARRGAAGRELVRSRFTWPAVASELAALYRSLAQRTPNSRR